jgi:hypothetical protein
MKNKLKKIWNEEKHNVHFNALFAIVALLIIVLFYDRILLATILEILLGIAGLIKWKSKVTLIVYFICAFLGTLAESVVVSSANVWTYAFPNFLNVPVWLFFLWGNAGAFIYEIAKEVKKMRGNKEK